MNEEVPLAKRQRTASSPDPPNLVDKPLPISQRPRHPTLWFRDGSVVFATATMLFCVYQGILCSKSSVFHDIFSLPQPAHTEESDHDFLEGKPVIVVAEDESELATFFSEIFLKSLFRNPTYITFDEVSAILRLSMKYEMDDLRKDAIRFLKPYFPTDLEQWSTFLDKGFADASPFDRGTEFLFLQLFHDIGLPAFKPAAFLWAAWNSFDYIIQLENSPDVLSPSCRQALLIGRNKLLGTISRTMLEHIGGLALRFRNKPCKCLTTIWYAPTSESWRTTLRDDRLLENLDPVVPRIEMYCSVCKPEVIDSYSAIRQTLWDQLPACFGLPDWETLTGQLASDLSDHLVEFTPPP